MSSKISKKSNSEKISSNKKSRESTQNAYNRMNGMGNERVLGRLHMALSIIAASIIPLLVYYFSYNCHLSEYTWYPTDDTYVDGFLGLKMYVIILLAAFMLIVFIDRRFSHYDTLPWHKSFWLLVVYIAFDFIAGFASKHIGIAFSGVMFERFESVFSIAAYIVICYYAFSWVQNDDQIKYFVKGSAIFAIIEFVIILFQEFGLNIFNADAILTILTSSYIKNSGIKVSNMGGSTFGTLGNVDFVQAYFACFLPVIICAFIALLINLKKHNDENNRSYKIIISVGGILAVVISIFALGDSYESLIIGIVFSLLVFILVVASRKKKSFITVIAFLAVLFAIVIITVTAVPAVKNKISTKLGTGNNQSYQTAMITGMDTEEDDTVFHFRDGRDAYVSYTADSDNKVDIVLKDQNGNEQTIKEIDYDKFISMKNETASRYAESTSQTTEASDTAAATETSATDTTGDTASGTAASGSASSKLSAAELEAANKAQYFYVDGDEFNGMYFCSTFANMNDEDVVFLSVFTPDNYKWTIYNNESGGQYYYANSVGKLAEVSSKKEYFDIFPDDFASGRGDIWNRDIYLMTRTVFLGKGASTFILNYPQDEYVRYAYTHFEQIIEKAHNYYAGSWIEIGGIPTICLIIFLLYWIVMGIKVIRRINLRDEMGFIYSGFFIGMLACMVIYLANDALPATAPVFYTFFGVYVGMTNRLIKKFKKEEA